ncbi:MAG: hypothetical protein LBK58_04560, partial [Prevotellaceae bacterium]|nr:hypothetical protein [Prevotellaceae bacterium]
MINKLINRYQSIDGDSRRIVNLLALTAGTLSHDDIARLLPDLGPDKIKSVLYNESSSGLLVRDYGRKYITNISLAIWLFPLIC